MIEQARILQALFDELVARQCAYSLHPTPEGATLITLAKVERAKELAKWLGGKPEWYMNL